MALYHSADYQINWPFGSGEEVQNRFPRQQPLPVSCISDWNDFRTFLSTNHLDASYQVWSQMAFRFRRSEK